MLFISVLIYDLFIGLYQFGAWLLSFQNEKAAKWYAGRDAIFERLQRALNDFEDKKERIWMHCASLGEFEQGRPVLEAMRKQRPDAFILLTFFSPSGYEMRKNYPNADLVFYLPLDTRRNARLFVEMVRPGTVIFVKYEFWYHFFMAVKRSGARFILISALFRQKQAFFKWYGGLYRKMLRALTHIFVQDQNSIDLLHSKGFKNVSQANDTRIDRVKNIAAGARTLPTLEMFLTGSQAVVGGSVYSEENGMIRKAFLEGLFHEKLIIVPHQVDNAHILEIKESWGDDGILYSEFNEREAIGKKALIVDSVGILSNIYKYASMAIIGGGFGKGIHNTLEPAAFGIPIMFGPNYQKFIEAGEMIDMGVAFSFTGYESFKQNLLMLEEPALKEEAGKKARAFIDANSGGTDVIMGWLFTVNREQLAVIKSVSNSLTH